MLVAAIREIYSNPGLHPPLTRTVCPLHDGTQIRQDSDRFQCADCGLTSCYPILSEEEYLKRFCEAEESGVAEEAIGRLEFEQDAATLLFKTSAVRKALEGHPLKVKRISPRGLCRHCHPGAAEVTAQVVLSCLLCEREVVHSLDLDGLQAFLTALWFKEEHIKARILSTKLPIQFCIDYFFCHDCIERCFPEPFREPEYVFVD